MPRAVEDVPEVANMDFKIVPLQNESHTVPSPETPDGWDEVIRTVLQTSSTEWTEKSEHIAQTAANSSLPTRSQVHCQCTILKHLTTDNTRP